MDSNKENYNTKNVMQKVDSKIEDYYKNKNKKIKKTATVVCSLLLISCTTFIVGASTETFPFKNFFSHAIPYTKDNAEIVKQELIASSSVTDNSDTISESINDFKSTEIHGKKIITPEAFYQQTNLMLSSISNFKSIYKENNINYFENIAIYPANLVILTDENENGWHLKTNDIVNVSFKEDISATPNTKRSQPFSFGYILNGKVYEMVSENSKKLNTKVKIDQDGEYYFYVINAAADQFVITDIEIYK